MNHFSIDTLNQELSSDPVKYDYLIDCLCEVRSRLSAMMPKESIDVNNAMDIELLKQELEHGVFESRDFVNICTSMASLSLTLTHPDDRPNIVPWFNEQIGKIQQGNVNFTEFVPSFLTGVHACLDAIIIRQCERIYSLNSCA